VSPSTIREAFQLISAADRVLSGVSSAGRQILTDLNQVLEPPEDGEGAMPTDGARRIEADPRKSGGSSGASSGVPSFDATETPLETGGSSSEREALDDA